jgi:hypothetical protein
LFQDFLLVEFRENGAEIERVTALLLQFREFSEEDFFAFDQAWINAVRLDFSARIMEGE